MPGYLPPPTPPGSLGWAGQTPQPVTKSGLLITPGVGVVGRTIGGQLYLDAIANDPPLTLCTFIPGALAAGAVATLRQGRASGKCLVSLLEANAKTPQTTYDPANYTALQIAGSIAGSMTLPFSAANQKHFLSDHTVGVPIQDTLDASNPYSLFPRGWVTGFVPTATTTITGFSSYQQVAGPKNGNGAYPTIAGASIHGCILDSNFNVIPGSDVTVTCQAWSQKTFFNFPVAIVLNQGSTYYFGIDVFNTQPDGICVQPKLGANALPGGNGGPVGTLGLIANGNSYTAPGAVNLNGGKAFMQVYGQNTAVELDGDITLSVVNTGVPVATAIPADVNVRLDVLIPGLNP